VALPTIISIVSERLAVSSGPVIVYLPSGTSPAVPRAPLTLAPESR
jgi:hypothetical protein